MRHSPTHLGGRTLFAVHRGVQGLGTVIAPVHFEPELTGLLGDEQAQTNRRGKKRPVCGWRFRRGVIIGRVATGGGGVEIVVRRLVALLGFAGLQGYKEAGEIPARGSLGEDFGLQVGAVLGAGQVQTQGFEELATDFDGFHFSYFIHFQRL